MARRKGDFEIMKGERSFKAYSLKTCMSCFCPFNYSYQKPLPPLKRQTSEEQLIESCHGLAVACCLRKGTPYTDSHQLGSVVSAMSQTRLESWVRFSTQGSFLPKDILESRIGVQTFCVNMFKWQLLWKRHCCMYFNPFRTDVRRLVQTLAPPKVLLPVRLPASHGSEPLQTCLCHDCHAWVVPVSCLWRVGNKQGS